LEFLMNALRLIDGVPAALYGTRTGQSPATLEPALSRARADGLLVPDPERLAPTPLGLRYLNEVLLRFMGDG
jgi:oxygen-independent coproporphyrinogen-3 oxidase